jgi:hypothetical protein
MTPEDADQLERWVATLDARQLTRLWHWLTLVWVGRYREEFRAWVEQGVCPSWRQPE